MSSILIIGENAESKVEELFAQLKIKDAQSNPDLRKIEPGEGKKSIGIEQTRGLAAFLSKKPASRKTKTVLIRNAHLLTVEAQSTLLKILEEAPDYAFLILCTRTENALLPTVVSRCKKLYACAEGPAEKQFTPLAEVLEKPMGERLAWVTEIAKEERSTLIMMLDEWVAAGREALADASNSAQFAQNLKHILTVKKDLEQTNVTLKLALEYLVTKLRNRV